MRTVFIFILTSFLSNFSSAQIFSETDKYKVTIDEYDLDSLGRIQPETGDTAYVRLWTTENEKEIFSVPLYSEFYDGHKIQVASDIDIDDIDHVIRFTDSYLACCFDETSYYFMIDNNGEVIPLPYFTETFCDGPEPFKAYTFDNNKITLKNYYPNQNNQIDSTQILVTYRLEQGELIEEK